jgi:hypothetical protein
MSYDTLIIALWAYGTDMYVLGILVERAIK